MINAKNALLLHVARYNFDACIYKYLIENISNNNYLKSF